VCLSGSFSRYLLWNPLPSFLCRFTSAVGKSLAFVWLSAIVSFDETEVFKIMNLNTTATSRGWRDGVLYLVTSLLFVTALSHAQEQGGTSASLQAVSSERTAEVTDQKKDSETTAPVFVPEEVQDTGGRWIIPEGTANELAVRQKEKEQPSVSSLPQETKSEPQSQEMSTEQQATPAASKESSQLPEKPQPQKKSVATEERQVAPDSDARESSRKTESQAEDSASVPPRPTQVTVRGRVESVRVLPKNELELTVKSKQLGRVQVLVSPLDVQRVPGKGRNINVRGYLIREGREGRTVRAMEIVSPDD
jgi:hypothetical protein